MPKAKISFDPEVKRLVFKYFPNFDMKQFAYMKVTHERAENSGKKMAFGKPTTPDPTAWARTRHFMRRFTEGIDSRVKPTSEEIRAELLDTSPGLYFEDMMAGGTKLDLFRQGIYGALLLIAATAKKFAKLCPIIKYTGKEDTMPWNKVEKDEVRGYTPSPLDWYIYELYQLKSFTDQYAQLEKGVGLVLQKGGLISLFADAERYHRVKSGDASNYDNTQQLFLDELFSSLVSECSGHDAEETEKTRLLNMKLSNAYVYFPNGEVWRRAWGGSSARAVTTKRNTFIRRAQSVYIYLRAIDRLGPEMRIGGYRPADFGFATAAYELWNRTPKLYCGDDDFETFPRHPVFDLYCDQEWHKATALEVGMVVKEMLVTPSSEGHYFLGFTAKKVGDHWEVWHASSNKLCTTLMQRSIDPSVRADVIRGYAHVCPWDTTMHALLVELAALWGVPCPGLRAVQSVWTMKPDVSFLDPKKSWVEVARKFIPVPQGFTLFDLWRRARRRFDSAPGSKQIKLCAKKRATERRQSRCKMTATNKKSFMAQPKLRGLSPAEKLRRWEQHKADQRYDRRPNAYPALSSKQQGSGLKPARVGSTSVYRSPSKSKPSKIRSRSGLTTSTGSAAASVKAVMNMMSRMDASPVRVAPQMGAGNPTGLFSVTQVFEPTTCTSSGDEGRFGILCAPILGTPSLIPNAAGGETQVALDTYANYIVKDDSEYPTASWSDANNFESGTNTGSIVQQVDGVAVLCQQTASNARIVDTAAGRTVAMPFGTAPGFNGVYPPTFTPQMGNDGTNNVLVLPVGQWYFAMENEGTTITAATVAPTGQATVNVLTGPVINAAATKILQTGLLTVNDPSDTFVISTSAATASSSKFQIDSFANSSITDFGALSTVRPVAMQVLATCVAPILDRGGTISAALLQQNDLKTRAIAEVPPLAPGSPFKWEELARYNLPGAVYSGKFEDGAYAWWAPQDVANTEFVPPSQMAINDYPCIVVSGQFQTSSGGSAGGLNPIRVIVRRVFEYTSDSQALETKRPEISYDAYRAALTLLNNQPRCMANDQHSDWYRRLSQGFREGAMLAGQIMDDYEPLVKELRFLTGGMVL